MAAARAAQVLVFAVFLVFLTQVQATSEFDLEDEMPQSQLNHEAVVKGPNMRLMENIDCGGLCSKRCSLHSRPNVCLRACGTCCFRCNCVPPGTYGNREVCGKCYTDMKTHGGKPKCP